MRSLGIVLLFLLGLANVALAERKRIAILEFEGPSGMKLRTELVKLVQKSHTVIAMDSWNRSAKALSAKKVSPAIIKKVAHKLDVDAVIEATVTERRGGFRVRIRLRDGTTGLAVDALTVTTTATRFDKSAIRDIKDELIDVISSLDDEEDDPPAKKKRKG